MVPVPRDRWGEMTSLDLGIGLANFSPRQTRIKVVLNAMGYHTMICTLVNISHKSKEDMH